MFSTYDLPAGLLGTSVICQQLVSGNRIPGPPLESPGQPAVVPIDSMTHVVA
jgi:hypothetical protein